MSNSMFKRISQTWHRLFSSKKMLPFERMALDAWRATLSEECQRTFDSQLKAVSFVQHQAGGAKLCFFYSTIKIRLFEIQQPDLHAATVVLGDGSPHGLHAKIFVHRGVLFSIEFPKRPMRFLTQHGVQVSNLRVVRVVNHVNLS